MTRSAADTIIVVGTVDIEANVREKHWCRFFHYRFEHQCFAIFFKRCASVQVVPQERSQDPVPQVAEEIIEVVQIVPQELEQSKVSDDECDADHKVPEVGAKSRNVARVVQSASEVVPVRLTSGFSSDEGGFNLGRVREAVTFIDFVSRCRLREFPARASSQLERCVWWLSKFRGGLRQSTRALLFVVFRALFSPRWRMKCWRWCLCFCPSRVDSTSVWCRKNG